MSILVNSDTKVVVQGITGREGAFHAGQMAAYGTRVVAGVSPGKAGRPLDGIPVFNTVRDAVQATGANASAIFVPPRFAADAVMEAMEAGIQTVVCLTEGIPTLDMIAVRQYMKGMNARLIGPNTPGVISPGYCKIGVMAGYIHRQGRVGITSRSGTLTYEVVDQLTKKGIGQSTCVGIGGDPVIGLNFVDVLEMFEHDEGTDAVVIIGEIGGTAEEDAAGYFRKHMTKPVIAFIAGMTAPPGRRMGHAGAIISGGRGTAEEKMHALEEAGILVVPDPAGVGDAVSNMLSGRQKH
ncbi:MAG: succinate--CoA ligase subunit alpha [Syntrophorhabdaceae bacterium]|nr:succinate--CoA ligase subunit alpha [Syntrophorhabdaceae bacterium]